MRRFWIPEVALMSLKSGLRLSLFLSSFLSLSLSLTACSKLRAVSDSNDIPLSFFTAGDASLVPSTDKLAEDCFQNSAFDACVFLKNPVAEAQGAVSVSDLDSKRHFGIKLKDLDQGGGLENRYVQILTLNTPRLSLADLSLLKKPISVQMSYAEQLNSYYWADRMFTYLQARLGTNLLPQDPIKIYVDDAFTGYSSKNHSIHLQKKDGLISRALSGDVVLQLVGQSLAQNLSQDRLFPVDNSKHKICGQDPRGCCQTQDGCAEALADGFGDYVTAMMFPGNPRLGETLAASTAGQDLCGIKRDLASLSSLTLEQAFAMCTDRPGYAVLMGSWYAARWWQARQDAEAAFPKQGALAIDEIFFLQAKAWTGSSVFSDAQSSASVVAAQFEDGKYLKFIPSF